ncbi:MAG: DUF402 domain-containing protein [Gammaproteobacteria bacterium]|nr:DUF402 domain-containing protein [Gammaproteobacteria bacterium]
MYVIADRPDVLALYLSTDAELGFAPRVWPTANGRHPWDQGPETRWQGHGVLHLHRPDDAYAVWVFWHGPERRFDGWYLNLQAPFTRTEIGIDTLDHELDIVTGIDGSWRFKDLELLESYVDTGRFSREEVDAILAEGRRLGRMLDAGDRWWSDEWAGWVPESQWTIPPVLPQGWDWV